MTKKPPYLLMFLTVVGIIVWHMWPRSDIDPEGEMIREQMEKMTGGEKVAPPIMLEAAPSPPPVVTNLPIREKKNSVQVPSHPALEYLPRDLWKHDEAIVEYILYEAELNRIHTLKSGLRLPPIMLESKGEHMITVGILLDYLENKVGHARLSVAWPEETDHDLDLAIESSNEGELPTVEGVIETLRQEDKEKTVAVGEPEFLVKSFGELHEDKRKYVKKLKEAYHVLEPELLEGRRIARERFQQSLGADYPMYMAIRNTPEFLTYISVRRPGE